MVRVGASGRACFLLQEFSLTRKWISWQNWNLASFRFLKDRRNSVGCIQKSLFLSDSQEELSLYLSQDKGHLTFMLADALGPSATSSGQRETGGA